MNFCRYNSIFLGIRKESKGKWERRAALSPDAVQAMSKLGAKILVQPCHKRIFSNLQYQQAGAIVQDDLSKASLILGIKEVPINQLMDGKQYLFFSHTHKGQKHNMPLLQAVLDKKVHLMDYELLVDEKGARLVAFGQYAGMVGMINAFHVLGLKFLAQGYNTPFVNISRAYSHFSLKEAQIQIESCGQRIKKFGLHQPVVVAFTGDGNVSKGAQKVLSYLPHQFVSLKQVQQGRLSKNVVYGVQLKLSDYLASKENRPFDQADYFKNGKVKYMSKFQTQVLPYSTVFVNGSYWDDRFPKLISNAQLGQSSLQVLADISCDISGPIDCVDHATTIDDPTFTFVKGTQVDGIQPAGVTVMAVDNLPAEQPLEATQHFSSKLMPLLKEYVQSGKCSILANASIAKQGKLEPAFSHLSQDIANIKVKDSRNLLLLGSGMVAAPVLDYFLKQNTSILLASNQKQEAVNLARGRDGVSVTDLDVNNQSSLETLVGQSDLTISFVPATLHTRVAEACILKQKHLVTASYTSPQMEAMDSKAKKAGITILNEVGLDPGIDHLLAMQFIDDLKNQGGYVESFVSWCGGLPSPECSDNPLGYKFSWSPKGVLTAALNPAQYKMKGQMYNVKAGGYILDDVRVASIFKGFNFEVLPNRDSMKYVKTYGLNEQQLHTMYRGTLRFRGFVGVMKQFRDLGLLQNEPFKQASKWYQIAGYDTHDNFLNSLSQKEAFEWLGLTGNQPPSQAPTKLDALCSLLQDKLKYMPDERDLVVLYHEFGIVQDGKHSKHTLTMVEYGDPNGYSAMSKTVALPAAIGADLILKSEIGLKGVIMPTLREVYQPMLRELKQYITVKQQ